MIVKNRSHIADRHCPKGAIPILWKKFIKWDCEEPAGRRRLFERRLAAWFSGAGRSVRRSNLTRSVIPECFYARAHARSTSLRALARALFGMSLSLISESVREELDVLLRKCRGSRRWIPAFAGMTDFFRTTFLFLLVFFGFALRLEAAQLKIATTILPVSDMVKSIAGEKAEVVTILPPGANPHLFELTPRLIKKLDGTILIFRVGKGFDDWIARVFDHLPASQLIQLDRGINLINQDPHYWLSIENARVMVRTITDKLIEIDPSNEAQYEASLAQYLEELDQADQHIKEKLSTLPNKKIITFHDGWRYLTRDYGLEIVATIESSEGKEPTPKRLTQVYKIVLGHQIKVLFTEPTVPQSLADSIAHNFNLRLVELDPLGNKQDNQTYIKLMLHNADEIEEALT